MGYFEPKPFSPSANTRNARTKVRPRKAKAAIGIRPAPAASCNLSHRPRCGIETHCENTQPARHPPACTKKRAGPFGSARSCEGKERKVKGCWRRKIRRHSSNSNKQGIYRHGINMSKRETHVHSTIMSKRGIHIHGTIMGKRKIHIRGVNMSQ